MKDSIFFEYNCPRCSRSRFLYLAKKNAAFCPGCGFELFEKELEEIKKRMKKGGGSREK